MFIFGVIAFFFGIFQAFLLKRMLESFTSGKTTAAMFVFMTKLLLYSIVLALLVVFYFDKIICAAIGFTLGLPVAVCLYSAYLKLKGGKKSGDDKNENNSDN